MIFVGNESDKTEAAFDKKGIHAWASQFSSHDGQGGQIQCRYDTCTIIQIDYNLRKKEAETGL